MIVIDGSQYNVPVKSLKRKAEFLDKYAKRTEDGILHRELVGVYYNYSIEFAPTLNIDEYKRLWNKLTEPTEFHSVEVPAENGGFEFVAYFSNVGDELFKTQSGNNYFTGLTVNFIAKEPARG